METAQIIERVEDLEDHAETTDEGMTILQENVEALATVMLGPRRSDFEGGGRDDEDALVTQVREIYSRQEQRDQEIAQIKTNTAKLVNGGAPRAKLSVKTWAGIIVALIAQFGAITVAWITTH